ncbi:AMP-binding protein [Oceanospirillaceae bacterium]|nr:AMP-binding protein [Oceanospirillaceae bacterium]
MFDLGRAFLAAVERSPSAIAITDGELKLSFGQWFAEIQSTAHGLELLGLVKGDRLLVIMQNRWQMATLHWACQFAGIIITPINWRSTAEEISYYIDDSEPCALAYDDASAKEVLRCAKVKNLQRIVVGEVCDDGALDYVMLKAEAPAETIMRADADDYSLMLYTSGTTNKPKGVPRRHRVERAAALAHVAQNLYRPGECTLGVMPLYHTMGVRSLLSMALLGGCFVCVPKFDVEETLRAIEREKVTNLYLVPTLYHMLIKHAGFSRDRVRSVEKIGFAGAPMSAGLLVRVELAFNPRLFVNHYGSSEIYTFTIDQQASLKPGSSGRAGLNQRVRVIPIDAISPERIALPMEEGQIIADMQSDESFEGYWNRPDADEKSIREGWYFTGDTGYLDQDGDLFVTGRVDDMVITGGENVSPYEIEDLLSLHPKVEEVAVIGIPDEQWGQILVAYIKARVPFDEKELDEYCLASSLADFKRPRSYFFVDEIPTSPVGKILKRKLRASHSPSIVTNP